MSNLDLKTVQIQLPVYQNYHILNKNKSSIGTRFTVMIPISKNEEDLIDNIDKETLHFTRGNRTFSVQMKDIYCYGEVNFDDKNTLDKIEDFNFLNTLGIVGVPIVANYNYETHSCSSTKNKCLWAETWSPSYLTKMAHGYLGKPKRILLFTQFTKK